MRLSLSLSKQYIILFDDDDDDDFVTCHSVICTVYTEYNLLYLRSPSPLQ